MVLLSCSVSHLLFSFIYWFSLVQFFIEIKIVVVSLAKCLLTPLLQSRRSFLVHVGANTLWIYIHALLWTNSGNKCGKSSFSISIKRTESRCICNYTLDFMKWYMIWSTPQRIRNLSVSWFNSGINLSFKGKMRDLPTPDCPKKMTFTTQAPS